MNDKLGDDLLSQSVVANETIAQNNVFVGDINWNGLIDVQYVSPD